MNSQETNDLLLALEPGEFLLHGSTHYSEVLEPRQPIGYTKKPWQNLCAIYATPLIEFALIKATARTKPGKLQWKIRKSWYRRRRSTPIIEVTGEDLEVGPGYIYVLPRSKFHKLPGSWDCVLGRRIAPLAAIRVTPELYEHYPHIHLYTVTSTLPSH